MKSPPGGMPDGDQQTAPDAQCPDSPTDRTDYPAGLRRRRSASWRMEVQASGRSDPWFYDEPPLTDVQVAAWRAAIAHLAGLDLPPVIPAPILAALKARAAA